MAGKAVSAKFDAYSDTRFSKNFMIMSSVIFLTLFVVSYISWTSLALLIEGYIKYSTSIKLGFKAHVWHLYRIFTTYWLHYIHYHHILHFYSQSFLIPKLFVATFVPYGTTVLLAWVFRYHLTEAHPFKASEELHGDAHWASFSEIKKSGLFEKEGMLMGEYKKDKYFVINDYQHTLLFAPTGSGKGVGFVIPNLLFWRESVFVHDIKLENLEFTSGYRSKVLKQKVYGWVPASSDGKSHCYNPLDWISSKPGQMVDDVQKIGNILIEKQEFWENEARALVTGVILFLIADDTKPQTFGEVVRTLRSDDTAHTLASGLDVFGAKMHPVGYMNLAAFLQKAEKERSGCISTANSRLDLWANPMIDKTTSRSDFDISTFKVTPTTVYVGLTPDNIQRLRPLMSMFYQQASQFLTRWMPRPEEKYGVLFLMDEFPTLGKMEQFLSGIAYFRGYKVKLFLVIQDTQQLKTAYEDSGMNSFLSNSTYRITFAANNTETAKLISELIGNKTVATESMNKPKYFDFSPASRSVHLSKSQRALLLPQEVISLNRRLQIILIEASNPIQCNKILYYKDQFFIKRLLKSIELPTQEITLGNQNKDALDAEIPETQLLANHPDAHRQKKNAA
ncbi:MAG: type IV secretion system protein VirD4 [Candidatus Deianiraeaceae bacterium]|jgi:type IV secretion system protein VirD4